MRSAAFKVAPEARSRTSRASGRFAMPLPDDAVGVAAVDAALAANADIKAA